MEKNMDCKIARDLMQLDADGILSAESEKFLREHLEGCGSCRDYMEQMKEARLADEALARKRENALLKALKRRKYELTGFIAGMVIMLLLLPLGIFLIFRMLNKESDVTFRSGSEYKLEGYKGISKLKLFPEKADAEGRVKDYYYSCKGTFLYQKYCISLDCSYSAEEYAVELERLKNTADKKQAVYSEEEAALPMVYAMLYDDAYEYAILDKDSLEIRYIYLQSAGRDKIPFDQSLLPRDYGWDGLSGETGREAFSIYK